MASEQSNFVRNEIREAVREEVSRLLGSTSATSNSTATGTESSRESNNERPPATPQTQSSSFSDCPSTPTPRTRTLSFEDFYKMRESQRQSGFKISKKKKKGLSTTTSNAPKKSTNVEIKVGIAAQTDGLVKVRRGKTHVVTVSSSATKEEITQKAIEKHRSFDQTFDETVAWVLLYPDFREIQWIPGTTQPFILSNCKQAICKDYKRLTFYLIPLDDVMESLDESGNESSKLSSLPDIRKYALNRVPANSPGSPSVVHIDHEGETAIEIYNTFTFPESEIDKIEPLIHKFEAEAYCTPKKNLTYEHMYSIVENNTWMKHSIIS
ncbi:Hypothetical predicted protein [Paramuricea clavata]|uniref:Uncharacterized protein n=1 Tax=Paramuricea clavata TaxID=317549 RepID=A0A7D9J353_PARCT|nr:Hypothetical predicted protein [Paramuricea clavata]